jgi:aminotransferase in exopolysaccharide biosynthesis
MYKKIVKFIQNIYGIKDFIPLHEPRFIGNEKKYLSDCIDSTFVSSVGKYVDMFEKQFASYVGSKYAIATINGTSALHIALILANVKQDDEVITQALSFVATSNAISYIGAKPIFIDINRNTLGLSHKALKKFLEKYCVIKDKKCINKTTNKIIKACIPMHTFGHPCKIDEIKKICDKWHIVLVEDSAESLGSYYKNKHTGTFGKLGIFSFNGNKIITSGGGGVIVTNNEELAKKAKYLTTTAKIPHKWEYKHDSIGYNYRMPNLNASLLVAQLEQLNKFLKNKRELAKKYKKFFKNYDDIDFIKEPKNSKSNYWLNGIIFKNKKQRDKFLKFSNKQGIMTRPIWQPLNQLNMYKDCQCDSLKNTKYLSKTVVNISSSVI